MRGNATGGALRWIVAAAMLASCRPSSPAGQEPSGGSPIPAVATAPSPSPSPVDTAPARGTARARDVSITVLSTSKATVGEGEWGFCALVDVDGERILFDTGAKRQTVLRNAKAAGVDLSTVPHVVLSHHHGDHVGGLLTLRRSVSEHAPEALRTVHVARGMFTPRRRATKTTQLNEMIPIRAAFEQTGGRFVVHDEPEQIVPGVWVTGPVPRVHPERNWSGSRRVPGDDGWIEDTLPESQALVIDTDEGLVVISGCGHAGIVNTLEHARSTIRSAKVRAALGGFHLHKASAEHLDWTAEQLRGLSLESFYGAHCTGAKAVEHFGRSAIAEGGESREIAVGWTLTLGE